MEFTGYAAIVRDGLTVQSELLTLPTVRLLIQVVVLEIISGPNSVLGFFTGRCGKSATH